MADEDDVTIEEAPKCEIGLNLTVIWISLIILVSLMALKEIFQILQSPFSYVVIIFMKYPLLVTRNETSLVKNRQ